MMSCFITNIGDHDDHDDNSDLTKEMFAPRLSLYDPDLAISNIVNLFANESSSVKYTRKLTRAESRRPENQLILGDQLRM